MCPTVELPGNAEESFSDMKTCIQTPQTET